MVTAWNVPRRSIVIARTKLLRHEPRVGSRMKDVDAPAGIKHVVLGLWLLVAGGLAGCQPNGPPTLCTNSDAGSAETTTQAIPDCAGSIGKSNGTRQPIRSAQGPAVTFIEPRPIGFKMDFSRTPEEPAVIELSSIKFGRVSQSRLQRLVDTVLAKYPPDTIGCVSQIFIGGTLTYNGRSVGGFQFLGIIFIATGDKDAGAPTDEFVTRALHHEISHSLLDANWTRFDAGRFQANLPPGFAYNNENTGVVLEKYGSANEDVMSLELLRSGFLVEWAKRNQNEDFASYAEVLLARPGVLFELFKPDSRVGRKARIVREFYLSIDPRFEQMFERPVSTNAE